MTPDNDTHLSPPNPRNAFVDRDGYPSKYFLDWLLKGLYLRVGKGTAITQDQLEAYVALVGVENTRKPFEMPELEIPDPSNDGNFQKALEELAEKIEASFSQFNTAAILQAIDGLSDLVANQSQQRQSGAGGLSPDEVSALIESNSQANEIALLKQQIADLTNIVTTPQDDFGGTVVHRFKPETINNIKTFTSTITSTIGTTTTSQPAFTATQTWNAGGVTFVGQFLNVTNTASAAASMLADWQVGGVTKFNVSVGGTTTTLALSLTSVTNATSTITGTFQCAGGGSFQGSGYFGGVTMVQGNGGGSPTGAGVQTDYNTGTLVGRINCYSYTAAAPKKLQIQSVNAAGGDLELGNAASKVGFYGQTGATRAANPTATGSSVSSSPPSAVSTTAATNVSPYGFTTAAQADALPTAINSLITVSGDLKTLANSLKVTLDLIRTALTNIGLTS